MFLFCACSAYWKTAQEPVGVMAKKPLQISSLNIPESNLYILALVTTLSLTLNSSFSFQPLCVISLASQALPGYVYTAFCRQICTCPPYAAGWLAESHTRTPRCAHLDRTSQSLNGWALVRAPAWSHTSWFALSSALSGSQRGRRKSVRASKTPRTHSLGCCSERLSAPLCTPPQSCRFDFISAEQGLSPGYPSTSSVLSVSVLGCIQHDNRDSFCHLPPLGSTGMTHNF